MKVVIIGLILVSGYLADEWHKLAMRQDITSKWRCRWSRTSGETIPATRRSQVGTPTGR